MKRSGVWMRTGLMAALAGAALDGARAQGARMAPGVAPYAPPRAAAPGAAIGGPTRAAEPFLKLRKLPKLGNNVLQRTPEYNSSASHAVRKPREWAAIDVPYVTAAEWIDELAFTFHVMTARRTVEGKQEYSLYETTVRYVDVPRGEHLAGVVLPPGAVLRYGEPVALAVEIAGADGALIAADAKSEIAGLPADWWKNARVTDSASVVKRDGYLVDRTKSPFGHVNIDDYEAVK